MPGKAITPARRLLACGAAAAAAALALIVPAPPASAAAAGTVRAWGSNGSGEIGNGTAGQDRFSPAAVRLPAGTTVTSVRSGCGQSVAVTSTGHVLTWGENGVGQLGNGTTTDSTTPVPVSLPPGTRVTSARAGCENNLALTADGRVLAWGLGSDGELGDGSNDSTATPVEVPMPPGTRVTAVTVGNGFDLALTASGRVLSWGFDGSGQLGNGVRGGNVRSPAPVRLPGGVKVTAIAGGLNHVLASTASGGLLAWGDNSQGQLGNGFSGGFADVPVKVRLPKGARVRGMFAGCLGSLALTTAGQVLAWGNNDEGQLGTGKAGGFRALPAPVRMPKGTKVAEISAGCLHNMARTADGRVLTWGRNHEGELGNGNSTAGNSARPVRVKLPAGQLAVAIGAGPESTSGFAIVRPGAR